MTVRAPRVTSWVDAQVVVAYSLMASIPKLAASLGAGIAPATARFRLAPIGLTAWSNTRVLGRSPLLCVNALLAGKHGLQVDRVRFASAGRWTVRAAFGNQHGRECAEGAPPAALNGAGEVDRHNLPPSWVRHGEGRWPPSTDSPLQFVREVAAVARTTGNKMDRPVISCTSNSDDADVIRLKSKQPAIASRRARR